MFDDVLCFSHVRWGSAWQRPHHLMSRFARRHRVFFIEEPLFDDDPPRLQIQRREHGLHVVVPHLPPGTSHDIAAMLQHQLLDGLLRDERIKRPLLWLYTPAAMTHVRRIDAVGCVHDCMDELSAGASREEELFRHADLVFAGGPSLYEATRSRHRNVFAFPNSVDVEHFAQARAPLPEPQDQAPIPHPRVGFFGVIDDRVDMSLVDAIAASRPDLHLVLVGPVVNIHPSTLPRRPNIHWLGPKEYRELPGYIAGWDVAILPFARTERTELLSPTTTLEYLAAGRPVVSTSIRDVVEPYGHENLVRIADGPEAFAAAIDAALAERGTPAAEGRARACDAVLARTSWDATWSRMYALVDQALFRRGCVIEEEGAPFSTV